MYSKKRVALFASLSIVLIALVGLIGRAIYKEVRNGTLVGEQSTVLTVRLGGRFTVQVPDRGRSVGDSWRASVDPAGAVRLVEEEMVLDQVSDRLFGPANGGGAGWRYFRYDAENPGTALVTLSNCFQGCWDERTRADSKSITWRVTIN